MAFEATEDRVILKLTHEDKITESGLVIPQELLPIPNEGHVMAVGPGRYNDHGILRPMTVKVGDKVIFDKNMAYGVELEGEQYVVLPESGIHGILNEE